jgi:NADH:ubiquinone oxidoreductase subunit 2 (subunit N)
MLTFSIILATILFGLVTTRKLLNSSPSIISITIFLLGGLVLYNVSRYLPLVYMYFLEPAVNLELSQAEYLITENKNLGVICAILLLTGLSLVLLKTEIINNQKLNENTIVILISIATFGYIAAMTAQTLFYLYVTLEIAAFASYTLVGANLRNLRLIEAAIKYYLGTSLTSLLFLLGIAIIYSKTGTMNINQIAEIFTYNADVGLISGIVFIILGLVSKLALAPVHWFTIDTY